MESIASTHAWGLGNVEITDLEGVGASAKLNAIVGNSKASQLGRQYQGGGRAQATTTTLARRYYRAGLRTDRFTADSFTLAFKTDAAALADGLYSFNKTMDFITKCVWVGARLCRLIAIQWSRRASHLLCDSTKTSCCNSNHRYGAYIFDGATLGAALWRRCVV